MSTEATTRETDTDSVAAAQIAQGLESRSGGKPEPAEKAPEPERTAKPLENKGATDAEKGEAAALANELRNLKERLERFENEKSAKEQLRQAEDFRDDFILQSCGGMPRELMRKVLPATTDRAKLYAEATRVEGWFKDYVKEQVALGRVRYIDMGGPTGGTPPSKDSKRDDATPAELIASGLQQRRPA